MDSLRNRKPGQCANCGRHVAVGDGMVTYRHGRAVVIHLGPEHCEAAKNKQARETRENQAKGTR